MCMCPKQGKAQAVRNPAVFFSPTNPRIHLFFSLIFLAIPYFEIILFFPDLWIGSHRARIQVSAEVRLLNILSRLTFF